MRGIRFWLIGGLVLVALVRFAAAKGEDRDPPRRRSGLPPVFWPDDNPYTPEKRDLGWLLYFDKRLSSSDSPSLVRSCHSPDKAFTDGAPGLHRHQGPEGRPQRPDGHQSRLQHWRSSGTAGPPRSKSRPRGRSPTPSR